MDLGNYFPILKKKNPNLQKKKFFFGRLGFSVNTHTSYIVRFSFNLMAKVYDIANLFFIDQK